MLSVSFLNNPFFLTAFAGRYTPLREPYHDHTLNTTKNNLLSMYRNSDSHPTTLTTKTPRFNPTTVSVLGMTNRDTHDIKAYEAELKAELASLKFNELYEKDRQNLIDETLSLKNQILDTYPQPLKKLWITSDKHK